jgi:hypothetical protein
MPFVSPDGQWIGFTENVQTLKKVAVTGGPTIDVARIDGAPRGATWTSDDFIIFATNNAVGGLQRVPARGGTPAVLTKPDRAHGEGTHFWPEALPGGRAELSPRTCRVGPGNFTPSRSQIRA